MSYSQQPTVSVMDAFLTEDSTVGFLSVLERADRKDLDTVSAKCSQELQSLSRNPDADYIVPSICVKEPGMPLNYTYGSMKLSCIDAIKLYDQSSGTEVDRTALWLALSENAENMTNGELRNGSGNSMGPMVRDMAQLKVDLLFKTLTGQEAPHGPTEQQWRDISFSEGEPPSLTTWIDGTVDYYRSKGLTKSRDEVKAEIRSQMLKTRDAMTTKHPDFDLSHANAHQDN